MLAEGSGDSPKKTDQVTVHYHGTLIDGTVFDSSVERGQPATFPVNGVIPGWVEAQLMKPVLSTNYLFHLTWPMAKEVLAVLLDQMLHLF